MAGRRVCKVCRLPGRPNSALWDGPWRNNKTSEVQLLSVHTGGCADSLAATHTYITSEGKSNVDATKTTKTADKAADVEADKAAEFVDQDEQQGPLPAVTGPATEPEDGGEPEIVDQAPAVDIPGITSTQVMRYIRYREALPEFDPSDIARAIALELLDAPTVEDAMRPVEMLEAKDVTYRPLLIHGVKWQPSDKRENPDAFPVYAVMDLTDTTTGQRALVTCGGLNVVAIMIKADLAGSWPLRLQLAMVGTRSGNETYKVESWTPESEAPFA